MNIKIHLYLPSIRIQSSIEDDWDTGNEVVPEKVIMKAIQDRLHDTMQVYLDLKDKEYRLVNNERFSEYLDNVEHSRMRSRETLKRAQDKLRCSSGSNDDSNSSNGRFPKKTRNEAKKNSQSEAILCSL